MAIMEPRRLVALREFSRRLKVWAFIGREVCGIFGDFASLSHAGAIRRGGNDAIGTLGS
jgi:hypothetical protein